MDPVRRERAMVGSGPRLCLAALLWCAVSLPACSKPDAQSVAVASGAVTLTVGYTHLTGDDQLHGIQQAARLISREGLTLPNREGRAQPRLAESWIQSADGLTWRFKLRSNAFFHDGTRVDSVAVKDSLTRSLASSDIFQYPGLGDIVAIDAQAPDEVTIRLRARSTFLLDDLGVPILKTPEGAPPWRLARYHESRHKQQLG